jgi:hypothetical protein
MFYIHVFHVLCIYISCVWVDKIKNCLVLVTNVNNILQCITIHLTCNDVYIWCLMYILFFHTTCHLSYILYPTILIWHHITTHPLCQCPWSQQNHLLIQHCLSSSHPEKKNKNKSTAKSVLRDLSRETTKFFFIKMAFSWTSKLHQMHYNVLRNL